LEKHKESYRVRTRSANAVLIPIKQVENQVGLVRERFFTPRLRLKNYDELNAWLLDSIEFNA
jgi:hypothetical protein